MGGGAFTTPLATNKGKRKVKGTVGTQPTTPPLLIHPSDKVAWCGPVGNWNRSAKGKKGCFNGRNCKINDHKKKAKAVGAPSPGAYVNCGVNVALMEPSLEMDIVEKNQDLIDWLNEQKIDLPVLLAVMDALNRHHEEGSSAEVIYEDIMGLVEVTETNTEDVLSGGNNSSPMPLIKNPKSDVDSVESELGRDQDALAKNVRSVAEEQELLKALLRTNGALLGSPTEVGGPLFGEVEKLRKLVETMVDGEEEVDLALETIKRDLKKANLRVSDVETGHSELQVLMNSLLDSLNKERKGRNVSRPAGIGREEFTEVQTQLEEVRNQVNNAGNYLTGEVSDGAGELLVLGGGVHVFNDADIQACCENIDGEFPIWYDPLSVLIRISNGVLDISELQQSEIHEAKTGSSYEVSLYKVAWRSIFPACFFTKSEKKANDKSQNSTRPDFTAIKNYKQFNRKDGANGLGTVLRKDLKITEPKLKKEIQQHLGNDKNAIAVATYLLRQSCEFIVLFLTFMDNQFDQLLVNCHGDPPHSVKAQQEVWDLVVLLITVMFETLWTTRSEAETAYQKPKTAQVTYLRTTIKTHIEMEKFVAKDFVEHHDILPKLFRHIFESFVSRTDFDKVKEETEQLRLEMNALTKTVDTFNTKLADAGISSGVPRLSATQRKKLRQKEAKAAAEAAKGGEDSD